MNNETGLATLVRRLNENFVEESTKLLGGTLDIPLGISVGAVTVPAHGRDYETIFPLADSALYVVKKRGKHDYALYAQEMDTETSREENLQREMARVTKIAEGRNDKGGALLLEREQFVAIYRFVKRFVERKGGNACKFLFVLSGGDGEALKEAAKEFGECLKKNLRRSDIILQNKPNEFFVLLPDLAEPDSPEVMEKVMKAWEQSPLAAGIRIGKFTAPLVYDKKET